MTEKEVAKTIAKNLRRIFYEAGKTQADVSRDLQINKGTLSSWMNGTRIPRMNKIDLLCHYFNVSRSDILEDNSEESPTRIPVLGRVAAGIPIEMIEDIVDWEDIGERMARSGKMFALRIKGESMRPKFDDGDVVIVRQQDDAESGDIVIATVNNSDATCKRIRKYKDGIELIPTNPAFEPMYYTNAEIDSLPVKIIGKVVELRARF